MSEDAKAPSPLRLTIVGHHEPDYPRNISVRRSLEQAGVLVQEIVLTEPFPFRHREMWKRTGDVLPQTDLLWVTEGGHRLVPLLSLLARRHRVPLIFDPFLSRYNTRVEDRRLHGRFSLEALICLWQDWSSARRADHLVFDTARHLGLFRRRYRFKAPATILPVGVDEDVFQPLPPPPEHGGLDILFWGTFIPLQGIPVILQAAHHLRGHEDIRFRLVGKGQTHASCLEMAASLRLDNVEFLDPVPPSSLPELASRSHLLLGIFDDGLKASNVVPNKVVQACALARPCLTRASGAIDAHFAPDEIATSSAGDAAALAASILSLRSSKRRQELAFKARGAFEREFSQATLARIVADIAREASSGAYRRP